MPTERASPRCCGYGTTVAYGASVNATIVNLAGVVPTSQDAGVNLAGNRFYAKTLWSGLTAGTTCHYRFELSRRHHDR